MQMFAVKLTNFVPTIRALSRFYRAQKCIGGKNVRCPLPKKTQAIASPCPQLLFKFKCVQSVYPNEILPAACIFGAFSWSKRHLLKKGSVSPAQKANATLRLLISMFGPSGFRPFVNTSLPPKFQFLAVCLHWINRLLAIAVVWSLLLPLFVSCLQWCLAG